MVYWGRLRKLDFAKTHRERRMPMPLNPVSRADADLAESPASTEEQDLRVGICPYFIRDRSKGVVYCECARFRFPDKPSRREIVYRYCAHPEGYKDCMLKKALDHYYERKYATHE
jgi:hypothetical protein